MSDVDKLAEAVNNIAQAFSDLNSDSNLHGASGFRKEIARLKAINAKLSGDVAKKTAEISRVRESQAQGWQEIELQRRHEEIRGLREDLHFKDIEIKELKGSLERVQKAAESTSKSNADLREQVTDLARARDVYRRDGIYLRDVLAQIRRAIDDHDDEED